MKKETLIIHTADLESLQDLTIEELGTLFLALMRTQREEQLPTMNKPTKMAYKFMAAQIERDNEKYEQTIERRREAGKKAAAKRWQKDANACERMRTDAMDSLSVSDSVSDSVSVSDSERYVSLAPAALPSLSPDEGIKIHQEYPEDAERLIEEVRLYYTNHRDKPFPGWFEAVKTFSHNQRRWGKTSAPRGSLQSMQEILNRVVPED